jgi:hypothetical protein
VQVSSDAENGGPRNSTDVVVNVPTLKHSSSVPNNDPAAEHPGGKRVCLQKIQHKKYVLLTVLTRCEPTQWSPSLPSAGELGCLEKLESTSKSCAAEFVFAIAIAKTKPVCIIFGTIASPL